ncbi:hypothetical protein PR048_002849 [Dryococelus australis]|uniref:Uncharacterized protein n=1 Tax=Dryococelus australis TaxID=614101 RepID=A0ABQ9ILY1_9NEOP|nr:hypothetical protein PR048_002849 [Dryococelus australis]
MRTYDKVRSGSGPVLTGSPTIAHHTITLHCRWCSTCGTQCGFSIRQVLAYPCRGVHRHVPTHRVDVSRPQQSFVALVLWKSYHLVTRHVFKFLVSFAAIRFMRSEVISAHLCNKDLRAPGERQLASHQGEPGSIRGLVTGFPQVGIVPDDAAARRVFSGISRFPPPLHFSAAPHSPHFTLIVSQDLNGKSIPDLSTLHRKAITSHRHPHNDVAPPRPGPEHPSHHRRRLQKNSLLAHVQYVAGALSPYRLFTLYPLTSLGLLSSSLSQRRIQHTNSVPATYVPPLGLRSGRCCEPPALVDSGGCGGRVHHPPCFMRLESSFACVSMHDIRQVLLAVRVIPEAPCFRTFEMMMMMMFCNTAFAGRVAVIIPILSATSEVVNQLLSKSGHFCNFSLGSSQMLTTHKGAHISTSTTHHVVGRGNHRQSRDERQVVTLTLQEVEAMPVRNPLTA